MRFVCLAMLTVALVSAQEIRLTIQADDLGAGHGINVAAIEAYKIGIVRTANVLMPAPWVPEAARMLNENPGLEAGVHLTLTSEWSTIKWRPGGAMATRPAQARIGSPSRAYATRRVV